MQTISHVLLTLHYSKGNLHQLGKTNISGRKSIQIIGRNVHLLRFMRLHVFNLKQECW